MGVPNYEEAQKISVDELIENAVNEEAVSPAGAIEHYTQEELINLAEKAAKNDLIVSIKAEHSNFYQGVMVCVTKREHVVEYIKFM